MSWGNFVTSWVDEKEIQALIGKNFRAQAKQHAGFVSL